MKVGVQVRVVFESAAAAKAAYLALEPDNEGIPQDLQIGMASRGKVLDVRVDSEDGMKTLISTVDEILEKLQVSQEVVGEVKE
ncbi:MAG: hypothetical protein HYU39_03025 [Thaumarchaeota archaeon]|nr:hypothetical protein [Nitrososphaerota archaeon]